MFRRSLGNDRRGQRDYEDGIAAYNRGELSAALEAFDRAVASIRDESHPYATLARFYQAETHARLGARLLTDGEPAQALRHLDAALAQQPEYPDLHFRKAAAHLRLGQVDPARHSVQQALALNSEFVEALTLLSMVHRQAGRGEEADATLSKAKDTGRKRANAVARFLAEHPGVPSDDELWAHLFDEERQRRRMEKAETLFHQGLWKESRELLSELVRENPSYPDLRFKLALVQFQLGDQAACLEHLDRALQRNPRFADARILAGTVQLREGRVREARQHYETARRHGLPSTLADYGLAVSRFLMGEIEEAAALIRPMAAREDAPEPARALLGYSRIAAGEIELARASFQELMDKGNDARRVEDAVALALDGGDVGKARRWLSKAQGQGTPALELARAEIELREGNGSRALELVEAAMTAHPDQPALRLMAAQLCWRAGQTQRALEALTRLTERWPDLTGAWALRGRVLRAMGRGVDALAALEQQRRLGARSPEEELEYLVTLRCVGDDARATKLESDLLARYPLHPLIRAHDSGRWREPLAARQMTGVA